MRRWAQASQRSTCPPNAAVRQRSIADMTFRWPRLTWPAWDARQAGPRWRKMSATSTAGRDNGRALAGHLQQEVERARHLADRANRDTCVERRRVELLVSEQNPSLRRGRLWMTRISVFCSRRWVAKLCRKLTKSFRATANDQKSR